MYSRRLIQRFTSTASSSCRRSYSTTQWLQRSPALSDIEPGDQHTFDQKQKEFREELTQKVKEQKEQERVSASTTAAYAAKSSSPSSASNNSSNNVSSELQGEGLGSLSTATGEAARRAEEANGKKKPGSGRFSSLIYGTEEGREMDRDIERSFSQVLARGKYVHSIVFHEVKPDKVDEYVELVGGWYPRMASMPENKVHLVGSWRTEVGDCDTFGVFSASNGINS